MPNSEADQELSSFGKISKQENSISSELNKRRSHRTKGITLFFPFCFQFDMLEQLKFTYLEY